METDNNPLLQDRKWTKENRVVPKEFNIVVTGIGGCGKTAFINRITGSASKVDHAIAHVGGLTRTKSTLGGYDVVFWETKCIREASEADLLKCPKPSVLILCINIMDSRFGLSHEQALKNVSSYFNESVWNHCIIALTCVDLLPTKPHWAGFDSQRMKEELEKEVKIWKSHISTKLASNNVPQDVVHKVAFFPVARKEVNSRHSEIIDERKSLDALKSACISVLNCSEPIARKSLPDNDFLKGFYIFVGGLVGCVGVMFPPLLLITVPCGVYIGGKVHSYFWS